MFIFETLQLADQLEQLVLNSEKANTFEAAEINEIFRIMHTIKGSAAMMLFNNISAMAHSMEDLFYNLRETEPLEMNYSKLCDLILVGIDFIKVEVAKIKEGQAADDIPDQLLDNIHEYLSSLKTDNDSLPLGEIMPTTPLDDINAEGTRYRTVIFFEDGCEMENMRAFNVIYKIEDIAQLIQYFPPDIAENNDSSLIIRETGFEVEFATYCSREELENFFLTLAFVESIEILELAEEVEEAVREASAAGEVYTSHIAEKDGDSKANVSSKKQSIISVQLNKLDQLLDLVGELVISEAMVTNNPDLADIQGLDNFSKAARQHRKVINELQDIVMSIRMVPLAGTFQKMNRIVRDMSKILGKQIDLQIHGEETEVDKNIIEHLSDPIMHLIRNAIDHGIEPAEERIARGKPAAGKIQLEAKSEGGDVWITVRDDGGGLDREKILTKALEHGLINKMEAELSDQEIYEFILLPGFSTNTEVTEFSGRGVGMDVVAQNIEEIGGSVYVDSKLNIGTVISLKIPLTLAIIDGMGIRVGSSIYTVPITSIRESFKAKEGEVFTDPDGMEMIMVRGECLSILRLHKIYKIETTVTEIHNGIIMIVETDNRSVCLFADELIGEQQVVVKALPKYLKKIRGIGGCTLLGNGRSSLILDIAGLVNY
ncbi:MAG TPA: chemotaxis protein CheA [Syntrophomonas sp.]|nr:chemotaxis protein CheA [Syntrophomonas sp.]